MKIDKLSSNGWFERLFSLCLGPGHRHMVSTTSDVSLMVTEQEILVLCDKSK